MADRPQQHESSPLDEEAFEEALDAAEVIEELAEDAAIGAESHAPEEDTFADEFAPVVSGAPETVEAAPAPKRARRAPPRFAPAAPAGPGRSIGELFKSVAKRSPASKIRVETSTVGALFRRFIEQG